MDRPSMRNGTGLAEANTSPSYHSTRTSTDTFLVNREIYENKIENKNHATLTCTKILNYNGKWLFMISSKKKKLQEEPDRVSPFQQDWTIKERTLQWWIAIFFIATTSKSVIHHSLHPPLDWHRSVEADGKADHSNLGRSEVVAISDGE